MTAPNYPNSSLVAVAWLKTVPGVDPRFVATSLPANNLTFGLSGFVTVTIAGGQPDAYLPMGRPFVQVDVYAYRPNNGRPPWNAAENICQAIIRACQARAMNRGALTLPSGYPQARVLECSPAGEPMRSYGDPGSLAAMHFDLSMHWTLVEEFTG